jgi:hypothetical protein
MCKTKPKHDPEKFSEKSSEELSVGKPGQFQRHAAIFAMITKIIIMRADHERS